MTPQSWQVARRYVLTTGVVGGVLLLLGRRSGWVVLGFAGLFLIFFRDPERRLSP
jgi:hypothetical protein